MSYRVLALKYRPQSFEDVVGQPHVTTTLTNAISSDRVAHAILLTGPRGTGKTTIARILAKAMNCSQGPTPTPCNQCKSCTSITSGNAADVFEIDGASNNSVDQIRELRENVTYMPSSSKFKIYIIDEVHMLSTAAFNALLKTLEEPPEHVLFIFATTEVHKIPVTILSRCQRHDLGRITLPQISAHLKKLSEAEKFLLSQESCDLLAGEADGSMRDSLSLLDRILSSSDHAEISHEEILNNLGIIDKTILFDLAEAVIKNDGATVLDLIDRVHNLGLDLKRFYASLIRHFRNIAVIKICNNERNTTDISDHDRERMTHLATPLSQAFLNQILNTLLTEESLVKFSSHTKTAVEMVLLKIVQIRPGIEIDGMIERLDSLAKRLDDPNLQEPAQPQSSPATAQSPVHQQAQQPVHQQAQQPVHQQAQQSMHQQAQQPVHQQAPQSMHQQAPQPMHQQAQQPMHQQAQQPVHQQAQQPVHQQAPQSMHQQAPQPLATPIHDDRNARISAPQATPVYDTREQVPPSQPAPAVPNRNPSQDWNAFLKTVSNSLPFVSAILSKGRLQNISDTDIVIELNGKAFERSRIESKRAELESICHDFYGRKLKVQIIGNCTPQESGNQGKSPAKLRQEVLSHPLVADAIKLFSGTVVDVKLNQRSQP
jgi:DNA polymerase-3 subunit gamma/tau